MPCSMETVRLTPAGLLATHEGAAVRDPLPALHCRLQLEAGCTLRSFFAMLGQYPLLASLSEFLPAALAEAGVCPATGCRDEGLQALVIGKTMELIGFPGEPRAESYLWLRGLPAVAADATAVGDTQAAPAGQGGEDSPPTHAGQKGEDSPPIHAGADREIRFLPLRLLLDLPLVLGGLTHTVLGGPQRKLFCATSFTLFETIDGLAWEFGFQSGAQQCSIER